MRHPVADRDDLTLVHVTHFNALFWDAGATPTRVIEHGIVDPGPRYTGELPHAAVVINEARRRGRVTGTDLLERFAARPRPLDLFGMDAAARSGGDGDLPQDRAARRDGPPARLPAPDPLDLARPLAARGDAPRDAGGRARHHRGPRGGAAGGGRRLDARRRARRRAARGSSHDPDEARARGEPPARTCSRATASSASWPTGTTLLAEVAPMRIAMVSEHASPLAVLGGVDAGGQNVHVAALASALGAARRRGRRAHAARRPGAAARGSQLTPRRRGRPRRRRPAARDPKDELLPHMPAFAADLREQWLDERPDVVHAHFWMSALAALEAADALGIPVVHTFHALGTVKRRHQGDARHQPAASGSALERDDRRAGRPDRRHLHRRGLRAAADWAPTGAGSPSSPAASTSTRFTPGRPGASRADGRAGCSPPAGWSSARASPTSVAALAAVPGRRAARRGRPGRRARSTATPRRTGCARSRTSSASATGSCCAGASAATRCRRCCAPPTPSCACPGTSRSGSSPLEAMACGVPVVATAVGGQIDSRRARRHRRARPAARPGARSPRPCARCSPTRAPRRALRRGRRRARARRYGFDRIARRHARGLRGAR